MDPRAIRALIFPVLGVVVLGLFAYSMWLFATQQIVF
jgi:hypothetical protein